MTSNTPITMSFSCKTTFASAQIDANSNADHICTSANDLVLNAEIDSRGHKPCPDMNSNVIASRKNNVPLVAGPRLLQRKSRPAKESSVFA